MVLNLKYPHKGPCVKGLPHREALLGAGKTFKRWGLGGDL
jgi:hypothetical protein